MLKGEDSDHWRAWVRTCAQLSIDSPAATKDAPPVSGLLGGLVEGMLTSRSGDLYGGREILSEVIMQARIAANEPILTWALYEHGRACGMTGDVAESARALSEAAELSHWTCMPVVGCMAESGLGMLFAQEGRSAEYERRTRAALAIAQHAGDVQGEAHALCNLGGSLTTQGRYAHAEAAYIEGHGLAIKHSLVRVQALALAGRGALNIKHGNLIIGQQLYDAAREQIEPLGDHYQIGYNELVAADLLLQAGDSESALRRIERATLCGSKHGLAELEVRASELRSEVLEATGRIEDALVASRESLRRERARIDKRVEASTHAGERSIRALLALKHIAWERHRWKELELSEQKLRAALTEETRLRTLIQETARTDSLTGIPNRRAHESDIREILKEATHTERCVAWFIIDIDNFKRINDTYGHTVGDEVIVEVARRLTGATRASGRVARWGGEEFTICALGVGVLGARKLAETLRQSIRGATFTTTAGPITVTASIGGAVHSPGSLSQERMFRLADAALYQAKREGRDQWAIMDEGAD
jgi:diguanylate cyclase (GGDEF)-like protein